jgi:hypothetical protein
MDRGLIYALALGLTNIVLNTVAAKAAAGASSVAGAVTRPMFLAAFIVGTVSLTLMIGLYTSGYGLAKGLLVAGATSIVLGVVWATILNGNKLNTVEWLLWASILSFYLVRALGVFGVSAD